MKEKPEKILFNFRITISQKKEIEEMARFNNKTISAFLSDSLHELWKSHFEKMTKKAAISGALEGIGISGQVAKVIADNLENIEELKQKIPMDDEHYQNIEKLYKEKYMELIKREGV